MTSKIKQRIEQIRYGNVPDGYKKAKAGILPADWDVHMLGDCLSRVEKPVEVKPNELYTQIEKASSIKNPLQVQRWETRRSFGLSRTAL